MLIFFFREVESFSLILIRFSIFSFKDALSSWICWYLVLKCWSRSSRTWIFLSSYNSIFLLSVLGQLASNPYICLLTLYSCLKFSLSNDSSILFKILMFCSFNSNYLSCSSLMAGTEPSYLCDRSEKSKSSFILVLMYSGTIESWCTSLRILSCWIIKSSLFWRWNSFLLNCSFNSLNSWSYLK